MKELDSVQVAQLKRIAEQLLETRQQKSISLDAVATATYIPQRLLQALEAEQFERLPEPVYVQGFIRRYADYLGLDGRALSQTFELNPIVPSSPATELAEPPVVVPPPASSVIPNASRQSVDLPAASSSFSNRVSEPSAEPERSAANIVEPTIVSPKSAEADATSGAASVDPPRQSSVPVPLTPPLQSKAVAPMQPVSVSPATAPITPSSPVVNASSVPEIAPKRPIVPLVVAGGAIMLLGLGAMAILNQPKPTARPTASNTSSDLAVNVAPSPAPSVDSSVPPSPQATPGVTNAPVQVAVNLTDRAWLEVVVDGKVEVEDVKEKGFQKTWTAERELFIRSGNAGAVLVSFNQAEAKPMGQVGQVEEATYTPDSALQSQTESTSQSFVEPTAEQLQSSSSN